MNNIKHIAVIAILAIASIASVKADFLPVIAGSGSPVSNSVSAAIGVLYSDQSTGQIWGKTAGGTNGWFIAAPSLVGSLTFTNTSAIVTNSAITTNSYALLTPIGASAISTNTVAYTAGTGTLTVYSPVTNNVVRYFIYTP
jgi:hypothetical protein